MPKTRTMDKNSNIAFSITLLVLAFLYWEKLPEKDATSPQNGNEKQYFTAAYGTPFLDGRSDDVAWQSAPWLPLDQVWLGESPAANDFSGRYKLLWDDNNLYVLAEITDDTLVDTHPDGLLQYWDDDCLEIFVDEDASGGDHQYSYNAFAYHIALDGKVVDIRPDREFAYFNEHCTTRINTVGQVTTWEVAVKIFDGNTYEADSENVAKWLKKGKKMGFALAYCDNDYASERENFMGSVRVAGEDKNRGWIDAGVFGLLTLE